MGRAFDAMAGQQLGDPDLAAAAILKLADSANPPRQLLLGSDALERTRVKMKATTEEIDQWEVLARSTDFRSVA